MKQNVNNNIGKDQPFDQTDISVKQREVGDIGRLFTASLSS